jgi:trigger factor
MQVTETLKDGLKRGYTITVTAAELDAEGAEEADRGAARGRDQGLPQGQGAAGDPEKAVRQRMIGDAMQDAIDGAMKDHFDATGDRPALQPEVKMVGGETWKEGQDVVVEMTYECLPPIPEVDAGKITLEKLSVKADDARPSTRRWRTWPGRPVVRGPQEGPKAKEGDQVVIDFKGSVDGELFEGGSARGLSAGSGLELVHSGL